MMKKIYLLVAPVVCLGVLGAFLLSNETQTEVAEKTPQVLSMIKSVDVPEKVAFAGEDVDLTRYDLYERYDREINSFSYLHSTTMLLIKKANRYFPVIEPILKKNGVPDDFKYLAVIESNMNPRAISPAKAAGLWQFMPVTGKEFGLEVGVDVDERYSIEKATESACKYLKQAYNKYGSWAAVAMSYNAGQGRITGQLKKQQVEDSLDLWLVEETSRYYFRMLAIKAVFENPYKHGFVINDNNLYKPMEFEKVEVSESIPDLASFAQKHNITYAQLKDFNSWLRTDKLTMPLKGRKSYTILIPTQETLYYKKGDKVKVHNPNWVKHD